jgi:hypothetical protein
LHYQNKAYQQTPKDLFLIFTTTNLSALASTQTTDAININPKHALYHELQAYLSEVGSRIDQAPVKAYIKVPSQHTSGGNQENLSG